MPQDQDPPDTHLSNKFRGIYLVHHIRPSYPRSPFPINHFEKTQLPKTGRQDQILKQALASVLMHIFGRGGEEAVRDTLKAEGKTPGDPADLWTMSRLLMVAGELKDHLG